MDQTINANLAHCIQKAHDVGSTKIYNICTGAIQQIPWGSSDWLGFLGLCGLACGVLMLFVGMYLTIRYG